MIFCSFHFILITFAPPKVKPPLPDPLKTPPVFGQWEMSFSTRLLMSKTQKSGGVKYFRNEIFSISLSSHWFPYGKDLCGGVWHAKLLRKRDCNGKQPSMRSTKEMTVKLEKVLAVWLVWKHFSKFSKMKLCQLASGQCFSVSRDAETWFNNRRSFRFSRNEKNRKKRWRWFFVHSTLS